METKNSQTRLAGGTLKSTQKDKGEKVTPQRKASGEQTLRDTKIDGWLAAKELLEETMLTPPGQPPNLGDLKGGMTRLAGGVNSTALRDTLLALAFYAEQIDWRHNARAIQQEIRSNMELAISEVGLEEQGDTLRQTGIKLQETAEQLNVALKALTEATRREKDSIQQTAEVTQRVLNEIGSVAKKLETRDQTNTAAVSYADIVRLSPHHSPAVAQEDRKARQLLIEGCDRRTPTGELLDETALVQRANLALDNMDAGGDGRPADAHFTAVSVLEKGGLVYEASAETLTTWLRQPDVREQFLTAFGVGTSIVDRGYSVVLDTVPTSFRPESQEQRANFERENEFLAGSVKEMRWMKHPSKWLPGQARAALCLTLNSAVAANTVIGKGTNIQGRRNWGRKLRQEPLRCFKCHVPDAGHFASRCPAIHETCSKCGKVDSGHTGKDCPVSDPKSFKCNGCHANGHHSYDQSCPRYQGARAKVHRRQPGSQYRYFPQMNDPSTWELLTDATPHSSFPDLPFARIPATAANHQRAGTPSARFDWYEDAVASGQRRRRGPGSPATNSNSVPLGTGGPNRPASS